VNWWTIIFGIMLVIALVCGWLVWVSRFVWQDQKLAIRYAAISGAATLIVMIIGMEKL
jgi:predicted negative regulator of RcsB-dependent stress response|tara:strand:+ start:560 stop:733 length:174 start_codon:yes stop_codon:yes gene_type:complete